MKIEVEVESDGRWVAEVPSVPGAMAYGASRAEAISKVEALVLRILADREEEGKRGTGYRREGSGDG
jgi:predicted RNase H-like HicB family nuclease